ncbi:MAG TPA: hypothetical protein VFB43_10630 [Terracidiphilus sp.]|jgi:hypothetical protein|nr:hypothetical protein [Terracidiphilus sp.]
MSAIWYRRTTLLIVSLAILAVLLFLLVPHSHSSDSPLWLAWLPVFFVGLISPLGFFSPRAYLELGRTAALPFQRSAFQRPPPSFKTA